ncbi:MAG: hypothetical protein LUP95_05865 [Euryarchaeota archaeon]|nr:hypothetical protein [Euryarchaeota archaeon]
MQTLTKGITPYSLTDTETYGTENRYGITLVSVDETLRQQFEPSTAPYVDRTGALKALHNVGLYVWVCMAP